MPEEPLPAAAPQPRANATHGLITRKLSVALDLCADEYVVCCRLCPWTGSRADGTAAAHRRYTSKWAAQIAIHVHLAEVHKLPYLERVIEMQKDYVP